MDRLNEKFLIEIGKIKEAEVFLGVARILKVKLIEDKDGEIVARDFADIFEEVMKAYDAAPRKRRNELYKILKEANKGEVADGDRTKNTKANAD